MELLIDATLTGFDTAYDLTRDSVILKAKARYIASAISGLQKNSEKELVINYLRILNSLNIDKFLIFKAFQLLRFSTTLQVMCIGFVRTALSIRKKRPSSTHFSSYLHKNFNLNDINN